MSDPSNLHERDAVGKAVETRANLETLAAGLRSEVVEALDPGAEALFETAAEVLLGLAKAFADYADRSEQAWRG